MVRFSIALTLVSASLSFALPQLSIRQDGAAGAENVGQGNGQQFITGACASAADCASGCCAEQEDGTAQCRARLVTEQSGGNCDFGGGAAAGGDAAADGEEEAVDVAADAAEIDAGAGVNNGTGAGNATDTGNGGGACGAIADGDGAENVGAGDGSQFITGQCFSPADCASGCCADQGDGTARCGAQFPTENERGQTCDFSCQA